MKKISEMTLKEKLGQLVMCGFEDPFYDEHARILIEDYKVGNIILFARNVKDMPQLISLNKKIYDKVIENTGIMPFISIDQEGGMVTRIMDGATFCPGNMSISASDDIKNAYNVGSIMGDELLRLGINLNLAPSLDTNNNPKNPVIGVRSYSDNPRRVSEFGNQYIKGLQEHNVIATAKHFPGHGDTSVDSHLGLATVDFDMDRLNNIELVPFKSAVKNGVKAIMSAHIIFKPLDDVPATLSKNILTGLLREEMGFEGLIVSDCMQMKAIDNLYTTEAGTVTGINAGLNIACVCHTLERQVNTLKALEEAVNNGVIPMEVIDERVERILNIKASIEEAFNKGFYHKNEEELVEYFNNIEEHKKEAQRIADESLTLFKGDVFDGTGKTIVLSNVPFAATIAEDNLLSRNLLGKINEEIKNIDTLEVDVNPENFDEIIDKVKDYDNIVYVTYNVPSNPNQAKLACLLQEKVNKLYIISSRNPYDALYLGCAENIVCLYEYTPLTNKTIVKYLKGEIKPNGVLPVTIEKRLPIGASLYIGLKEYPKEKNLEYIDLLHKNQISYCFISAQMEEAEDFDSKLRDIVSYAKKNKLHIILDVNKERLEELERNHLIDDISVIRLDYGFSYQEILDLQNKPYQIEMNASTISDDLIKFLKDNNADMSRYRLSHNFFPKPYTGLSFEKIRERNDYFHQAGFSVMAYMPGFAMRRPPLYQGLPTIEEQRDNNVIANVSELILAHCDMACFSDAYITNNEMMLAKSNTLDYIQIPIIVKKGISPKMKELLLRNHSNRPDNSSYMIRSSIRATGVEEFNCVAPKKGDVMIDNIKRARYQGEVGIALKDMKAFDGVNVVGRCLCNDSLIDNIEGGMKFKFVIIGEE